MIKERERGGPFADLPDLVSRTAPPRESAEIVVKMGTLDSLVSHRRAALCETSLLHCPTGV